MTRRAVTGVLALALLAGGCASTKGSIHPVGKPTSPTTTADDSDAASANGALSWTGCQRFNIDLPDGGAEIMQRSRVRCARLEVPLDPAQPNGKKISLAIAKMPATGSAKQRKGSLVVNPGGPGGSGLGFVALASVSFPTAITDQWDIVSFDPRGLGQSDGIQCLTNSRRAAMAEEQTPDDPTEAAAQSEAIETEIDNGCERDNAALLRHMGTSYVVDDLEAIRVALGDEPLHYLGLSYGTRIGAIYADRYPEHTGTIVLDGSVSPDASLTTLTMGQFNGISRAYDRFLSDCAATPTCPLNPDPSAAVKAALDAVTRTPMVYEGSDGPENLDEERFMTGIITSLYDPSTATPTAQAIAALTGSDTERAALGASFLGGLADQQNSRRADGTYDDGVEVQAIVTCADAPKELTSSEAETLRSEILAKGGPMAETFATGGKACFALPVDEGTADITSTNAAKKILIVGTSGDPATPIEWTTQMAEALGTASVLTYEGRGHTASLRIPCATAAVAQFLSTGTTSTRNCALDPDETDVYLAVGKQFEQLGLPAGSAACIATELRGKVDELSLVSDSEDPDPNLITVMQRATRTCSTGG